MWIKKNDYTINVAQIAYFEISGDQDDCSLYANFGSTDISDAVEIMHGTRDECTKLIDLLLKKEDVRQVV